MARGAVRLPLPSLGRAADEIVEHPARVFPPDGIVVRVAIAIQALRSRPSPRHRVHRRKPPQPVHVKAMDSVIVPQPRPGRRRRVPQTHLGRERRVPRFIVPVIIREDIVGGGVRHVPFFAVGIMPLLAHFVAVRVGRDTHREMVRMVIIGRRVDPPSSPRRGPSRVRARCASPELPQDRPCQEVVGGE
jgi:hypothetical protein